MTELEKNLSSRLTKEQILTELIFRILKIIRCKYVNNINKREHCPQWKINGNLTSIFCFPSISQQESLASNCYITTGHLVVAVLFPSCMSA